MTHHTQILCPGILCSVSSQVEQHRQRPEESQSDTGRRPQNGTPQPVRLPGHYRVSSSLQYLNRQSSWSPSTWMWYRSTPLNQ